MPVPAWHERASCRGVDPTEFDTQQGARWCISCPVQSECADDALTHGDLGVVRAGVFIHPLRRTQARRELHKRLKM